jgi:ribosomal protein S18 acetylase RimI-like enzyme
MDKFSFLKKDLWLTETFGYEVFHLIIDDNIFVRLQDYESEEHQVMYSALKKNVMIYCKIKPISVACTGLLFDCGFKLIDTNLTMRKKVDDHFKNRDFDNIRFATMEDEEQVAELARTSFSFSRFHLDPHVCTEDANNLKAEWARNFFRGKRGDAMVVAMEKNVVVAFLQLFYFGSELVIDLIAVDASQRCKSIAKNIIMYAANQCKPFQSMRVGTQIANIPSIRLYEALGFKVDSFDHIFHYHNQSL